MLTTILVHEILFAGWHAVSVMINLSGEKFKIIRKKVTEKDAPLLLQRRALRKALVSHIILQPILLWYTTPSTHRIH